MRKNPIKKDIHNLIFYNKSSFLKKIFLDQNFSNIKQITLQTTRA